jgi:phosphoheptose isomerase
MLTDTPTGNGAGTLTASVDLTPNGESILLQGMGAISIDTQNFSAELQGALVPTPEPASAILLAIGALVLAASACRRGGGAVIFSLSSTIFHYRS